MKLQINYNLGEAIKALKEFHEKEHTLNAQSIEVNIKVPNAHDKSYLNARRILKTLGYLESDHDVFIIAAKTYDNKVESVHQVRNISTNFRTYEPGESSKSSMTLCEAKRFVEAILDADNGWKDSI